MVTNLFFPLFTWKFGRDFRNLILIFFGLILLSGCSLENLRQQALITITPSPTITLLETINIPTSSTGNFTPTIALREPTFIHQPTWTLVPTLSPEIRKRNIVELFSTNDGCKFPCWWGIRPGDPIQKVAQLGSDIGESLVSFQDYTYSYTLSLDELNLPDFEIMYFLEPDKVVQHMEITLNQPSRFSDFFYAFDEHLSLSSLLFRYGKPDEVLFLVTPLSEPNSTRGYAILLLYDKLYFGILYDGIVDSENPIRVCSLSLDNYHLENIRLYFGDPRRRIKALNRFYLNEFKPLEYVTSMNQDEFYLTFLEPKTNNCLQASTEPWD